MKMRDELGVLYLDSDFVTLFRAECGQSAVSLPAISISQCDAICRGID
jgi:transposase